MTWTATEKWNTKTQMVSMTASTKTKTAMPQVRLSPPPIGKPHRPVYELCLKKLDGLATDAILGIGDSMQHDIAGGNGIGIDTLLLTHGVLRDSFAEAKDEPSRQAAVDRLEAEYRARPRWVLPSFIW